MNEDFDKYLDAKGLKCPHPLLLVKKTISQMQVGKKLKVESTDPHTDLDLEVWCERFGHEIVLTDTIGDVYSFLILKKV